jgi:hypothetical protein
MPRIQIDSFDGEQPRGSDTALPASAATTADNVRLYSGELQAFRGSRIEATPVTTSVQTIYRLTNTTLEESVWLTWDTDVNVSRGSLADVDEFRIYWTGDGTPKKSNWDMASDDTLGGEFPGDWLEMGVPAPTAAPTVAATSGSSTAGDTRYYVYTFVSTFGDIEEESAPSPVSAAVSITTSQSVNLSNIQTAPSGAYNITAVRIYRTVPGDATIGAYVFVKEITIGTTSTNDDLLPIGLGEPLSTVGWSEPPDDLQGLTAMANGMMAGFVGNSVYFSEPYFHHAWPAEYIQSIPDEIVGLGSYGNTLVVMTRGTPWLMVGVDPAAMSVERLTIPEPCISKRSIVSDSSGVMYASPNGIVSVGPQIRGVMTNGLFRRKEWLEYAPSTMVGGVYDGKYFLTFESNIQGNRTMVVSRDDKPALSFLDIRSRAFFTDVQVGELYYLEPEDNKIYEIDADVLAPLIYEWTSKRIYLGQGVSWSAVQVDLDMLQVTQNENYNALVASIAAANETLFLSGDPLGGELGGSYLSQHAINANLLAEPPLPSALLTCSLFILGEQDELLASLTIDEYRPYRLPAFRSRVIKIKLTGTINVRSMTMATSVRELRA